MQQQYAAPGQLRRYVKDWAVVSRAKIAEIYSRHLNYNRGLRLSADVQPGGRGGEWTAMEKHPQVWSVPQHKD